MLVMICVEDFCLLVKKCVFKVFYDYVDSGFYIESIYCVNIKDLVVLKLCQCVVINVDECSICSIMIGYDVIMLVVIVLIGLIGM